MSYSFSKIQNIEPFHRIRSHLQLCRYTDSCGLVCKFMARVKVTMWCLQAQQTAERLKLAMWLSKSLVSLLEPS